MPTTTARLGLLQQVVSDSPSQIRLADTANTNTLDNALLYFTGTLANRASVVVPLVAGALYRATDTLLYYIYNGTAWLTLPGFGQEILPPVVQAASTTMSAGFRYFAAAGTVMTLPAPAAGLVVGVVAGSTATGTSPVTVAYGSGGGGIYGQGLANPEASFLLGMPEATVILSCSDGTNWVITSGMRDTGWVPLTLGTGAVTPTGGSDVAASRVVGNRGMLRGAYLSGGLLSSNTTAQTAAGHFNPTGASVARTYAVASNGQQAILSGGNYFVPTLFMLALANGVGGLQISTDGVDPCWLDGIEWSYRT